MKRKLYILAALCLLLTGCGEQKKENWADADTFGDINIDAEVVNTNDVETEYEIDNYLTIEELNETKPNAITVDSFRIFYNRIGGQVGLPSVMPTNCEIEDITQNVEKRKYEEDGTGVYLNVDKTTGLLTKVYCEVKFIDDTDKTYQESVGRVFAPIFGGVPNLKKYDLNKAYFDIWDAMEDTKGKYSIEYNKINVNVKRDYGYVFITITYPLE